MAMNKGQFPDLVGRKQKKMAKKKKKKAVSKRQQAVADSMKSAFGGGGTKPKPAKTDDAKSLGERISKALKKRRGKTKKK